MKLIFTILLFLTISHLSAYEENWIDMGQYQYLETESLIEKIEISNKGDSVFVQTEYDLKIYDKEMNTVQKDIEPGEYRHQQNKVFLSPDLKSYVIIRDNNEEYYYFDYYFMDNDSLFHKDTAQYTIKDEDYHNSKNWSNFYPLYWKYSDEFEMLYDHSWSSLYKDYSSVNGSDITHEFSRNNKFRYTNRHSSSSVSETPGSTDKFERTDTYNKFISYNGTRFQIYYRFKHFKSINNKTIIDIDSSYGLDAYKVKFIGDEYILLADEHNIYKFDLNKYRYVDSLYFKNRITGIGYHKENLLFTSENYLYYYDVEQKKITLELFFPDYVNSQAITSNDSMIYIGTRRGYYEKYSHLIKTRISDMNPYFTSEFYAKEDTVTIGDTVEFVSYVNNLNWNFLWNFGDGKFSNKKNPKHYYDSTGYYSVQLIVSDSTRNDTTYKYEFIYVRPEIKALFYTEKKYIHKNESIHFIDTSIGNNLKYIWYFGDGQASFEQNPVHTYKEVGEYDVKLVVWNDNLGDTLVRKNLIKVKPPLKANFTYERTVENDKVVVKVINNSEGDIVETKWITFKGDTLYGKNPVIVYDEPGTYHLKLIVNDGFFSDTLTTYFMAYNPIKDIGIPYNTFKTYSSKFAFDLIYMDNLTNNNDVLVFSHDSLKIFNKDDFAVSLTQNRVSNSFPLIVNEKIYNISKKDSLINIVNNGDTNSIKLPTDKLRFYKALYIEETNKIYIFTDSIFTYITVFDLADLSYSNKKITDNSLYKKIMSYKGNLHIVYFNWEEDYDNNYYYYGRIKIVNYNLKTNKYIEYQMTGLEGVANNISDLTKIKYVTLLSDSIYLGYVEFPYSNVMAHLKYFNNYSNSDFNHVTFDFSLDYTQKMTKLNEQNALVLGSYEGKAAIEIFNVDSMTSIVKQLNFEGRIIDAVSDGYNVTFYGLYKQNAYQNSFFELTTTFDTITSIGEGLSSNISSDEILIYPNPSEDYIAISLGRNNSSNGAFPIVNEITIYNVLGERVLAIEDVQHHGDVGHLERIDISALPRGVYFVRIGDKTKKFVKE